MTFFYSRSGVPCFMGMLLLFFSCSDAYKQNELLEYNGNFPDESAKDITIIFSDSGRINFELSAPLFNTYQGDSGYIDCPQGITVISYDEYGEKQSILTADYAINSEKAQLMEARKNVVIVDLKKNERIESQQIFWDKKSKKIYSNVAVKQIKADGTVSRGEGFVADERFTRYTVFKPVIEVLVDGWE